MASKRITADIVEVPAGSILWDFGGSRPSIAAMKAAGVAGVIRYIAPGAARAKLITADEAASYHAAGIAVGLCFEWNPGDCLGDAPKGTEYGTFAKRTARALGYPQGLAIICANDTDLVSSKIPIAERYNRAFAAAIAPDYLFGFYGGSRLLWPIRDIVSLAWRANASAWSPASLVVRWDARQGTQSPDHTYDPNVAVNPLRLWLPRTGGEQSQLEENDDMAILIQPDDGDPAVFVVSGGVAKWVRDGNELDKLRFVGLAPRTDPAKSPRDFLKSLHLAGPDPLYPDGYTGPRTNWSHFGGQS